MYSNVVYDLEKSCALVLTLTGTTRLPARRGPTYSGAMQRAVRLSMNDAFDRALPNAHVSDEELTKPSPCTYTGVGEVTRPRLGTIDKMYGSRTNSKVNFADALSERAISKNGTRPVACDGVRHSSWFATDDRAAADGGAWPN
jgi:hypothetical protein